MSYESKTVVKIEMSGNRYNAWDSEGNKLTSEINNSTRKSAFKAGMALEKRDLQEPQVPQH